MICIILFHHYEICCIYQIKPPPGYTLEGDVLLHIILPLFNWFLWKFQEKNNNTYPLRNIFLEIFCPPDLLHN